MSLFLLLLIITVCYVGVGFFVGVAFTLLALYRGWFGETYLPKSRW